MQSGAMDGLTEVIWTGEAKGFGLRALRAVEPDDLVAEYIGEVVPKSELQSWRYAMHLKQGAAIDASRAGGPGRFMNHSCEPNCYAQRWVVDGEWRVGLFAARSIKPLEELTFSYAECGRGGFGQDGAPEPCVCGEPRCSGAIGVAAAKPRRRVPQRSVEEAPAAAAEAKCGDGAREVSGPAAALAARRAAAQLNGPPEWPHARWLCGLIFGSAEPPKPGPRFRGPHGAFLSAPMLRDGCGFGLEPWLAHAWPGREELALALRAGLYLPRCLAVARRAWLQRLLELPGMTPVLGRLLKEAVADGEPCAECGVAGAARQGCCSCGRAVHAACVGQARGRLRSRIVCTACAARGVGRSGGAGSKEKRSARLAHVISSLRLAADRGKPPSAPPPATLGRRAVRAHAVSRRSCAEADRSAGHRGRGPAPPGATKEETDTFGGTLDGFCMWLRNQGKSASTSKIYPNVVRKLHKITGKPCAATVATANYMERAKALESRPHQRIMIGVAIRAFAKFWKATSPKRDSSVPMEQSAD